MKKYILFLFLIIFCVGCSKKVTADIKEEIPKIAYEDININSIIKTIPNETYKITDVDDFGICRISNSNITLNIDVDNRDDTIYIRTSFDLYKNCDLRKWEEIYDQIFFVIISHHIGKYSDIYMRKTHEHVADRSSNIILFCEYRINYKSGIKEDEFLKALQYVFEACDNLDKTLNEKTYIGFNYSKYKL